MTKVFEHKIVKFQLGWKGFDHEDMERQLNDLGSQGWEAVNMPCPLPSALPRRQAGAAAPTPVAEQALAPDLARGMMLLLIALAHVPWFLFPP